MSDSHKGRPHPHRGHPNTPETHAAVSAANKGRPCTPETRRKIGATQKGRAVVERFGPEAQDLELAEEASRYGGLEEAATALRVNMRYIKDCLAEAIRMGWLTLPPWVEDDA